jgi:hypothetical protein
MYMRCAPWSISTSSKDEGLLKYVGRAARWIVASQPPHELRSKTPPAAARAGRMPAATEAAPETRRAHAFTLTKRRAGPKYGLTNGTGVFCSVPLVDAEFVSRVRLDVLRFTSDSGQVPDAPVVARRLAEPVAHVVEAFRQLTETHVYVLEPGDVTRLRMANPFSGIPTPFKVDVGTRSYFGNCVWDALGVVSLLGGEGRVHTHCPDCGERIVLEVENRGLSRTSGVVHFSVPARHWWDDIIHT